VCICIGSIIFKTVSFFFKKSPFTLSPTGILHESYNDYSSRHIKTYKVIDTVQSTFSDVTAASYKFGHAHASEVSSFLKLMSGFPKMSSIGSSSFEATEKKLLSFVEEIIMNPLSSNAASEKMLLMLLKQLIVTKGAVSSTLGSTDASSPETKIVKVILGDFSTDTGLNPQYLRSAMSQQAYDGHSLTGIRALSGGGRGEVFSQIEALLLCGLREDAADIALANAEYGLAVLIGGICSPEKYKDIVKKYADSAFPTSSTLNTLTKIFSNQPSLSYSDESFQATWRRNVAAIISNKSSEWSNHLIAIGDKLRDEVGDIMAAHFVYICAGILPSAPKPGSKFSLIGSNFLKDRHKSFFSIENLLALRLTEIFECLVIEGGKRRKDADARPNGGGVSAAAPSGIVRSLSGFLGLGGSQQQPQATAISDPSMSVTSMESEAPRNKILDIPPESLLQFRTALSPLKLRFAMLLADLGCIKDSFDYCKEVKDFIVVVEEGK